MTEPVDVIVRGSHLVTMNAARDVIRDGAVAVRDGVIVAAGKTVDVERDFTAVRSIGGDRFVVTPGMVNTHIHITGEPLTRGYVPDDTPFEQNVFQWLCPLYAAFDALDERTSGQLAAAEMLRSGTTTFLEAGTIRFLDEVVDGLHEIGIRARVGNWVWDLPPEPNVYRSSTDRAIGLLQQQLDALPSGPDTLVSAWSTLVGHTTCSDPLWRAAKALADEHGVGMSFHMSPAKTDVDGFTAEFGQRPMVHLDEIGVLDRNVAITHCVHVDDVEIGLLAERG